MPLAHLPTETLLIISSYLRHQRDVYALVRTNRRFYHILIDFLYKYNSQYFHASALPFVAKQGHKHLVGKLLDGLKGAVGKSRRLPHSERRRQAILDGAALDSGSESDSVWSDGSVESDEGHIPYLTDIVTHPLRAAKYSTTDINTIQSALIAAIRAGHKDIVTLLLDRGAQANFYRGLRRVNTWREPHRYRRRRADHPPLCQAVQCGRADLVQILLARGADPDLYCFLPLYQAVAGRRRDIIRLLLQHGAKDHSSSLKLAVRREDMSMVQFLLDNGVRADESGRSALLVAKRKGAEDIVEFLQSKGATLDGEVRSNLHHSWHLTPESDAAESAEVAMLHYH
ncbi:ankyrin repeat-containing protein [Aspergillus ibericus CBS 121593]|uniref:Ankyrin repeat-containing protein n=1 Tax=Aspergillus ibericus CBS 121593 TaxID=1448316 RepID=A0A395GRW5_9EURO|nr:ankyrin repeat-containing protein [Aspergillus ibericus CBS 121593]RAK98311.1 ankyrin repeat-containing protein [Aspergillus ibericus CBS 121593]